MKKLALTLAVVASVSLLTPAVAHAQDDEEKIIFGVYYRCDQSQESRADEVYNDVVAPLARQQVATGRILGSLWLTHSQGGAWRRAWTVMGTDLNKMMDAREEIVEELNANHGAAMNELQAACPSHDDYIWVEVENAAGAHPDAVGDALISAYHTCDMSREQRADEIFLDLLAPLYRKHTDMGHLASWGFYAHRIGGTYRRLETMSGADHKTLLAMQDAIYTEASEIDALAMAEFRSICGSHSDYMWTNEPQRE